jgi:hypothetical protein
MTFTVNDVRACSGGNHVEIDVTPAGGSLRTLQVNRDELLREVSADSLAEIRERIIMRCIFRVKENTTGNPTPLQVRNSLVGETFEV